MDFTKVKEEIKRQYYTDVDGSHTFDHIERVYNLCVLIAKTEENIDNNVLGLAALLHDIGRKYEGESRGKLNHAEKGAVLAQEFLEGYGLEKQKIDSITHCIKSHRFRNNIYQDISPQTIEAKILFDADKLDAIGAVGIGRAFLFAGKIGAKLHDPNIDINNTKEYTEEDTAYREFAVKLSKIEDKLYTKKGRKLAENRHKFMVDFFDRLNREVNGEI